MPAADHWLQPRLMNTSSPLPKYEDNLATFLGDLRSFVSSSQAAMARHVKLVHTTISRYENGRLLPPYAYMVHLVYMVDERLKNTKDNLTQRRSWLIEQVNEALRWNYPDAPLFKDWDELKQVALEYIRVQHNEPEPQTRHVDWGEAPDVSVFYGRDTDLTLLKERVVSKRCHLIMVAGMGGIGKTVSVTRLAHEVESDFEFVIWRSLRNAPALEIIIEELTTSLLAGSSGNPASSLNQQILRLLEFMRERRCLIVLDNLESIMDTDDRIGSYRAGHEDYRMFFDTIATTRHQSCVLLTSREVPAEFDNLSHDQPTACIYHLPGLPPTATAKILKPRGIAGSPEELHALNRMYSGNPMALKLVAETISSFFGGDVHRFLNSESTVFNDIRRLIDQSWDRLPALSHEVLYWLAVERQPLMLNKLADRLVLRRATGELVDVLQSLQRCSLVEQNSDGFFLPNVVSEYVVDRLLHQLQYEIVRDDFYTLHRVALLTTDSPDYVRQTQLRLIVRPLARSLLTAFAHVDMRVKFAQLLSLLRSSVYEMPGFAPGNLLNLMLCSGHEIREYDCSGLTIQHAYLSNVTLHQVDFSDSHLVACLFDNTFIGINTVALSRQAQFLALASGGEVRIWRLWDRQPYRLLSGHHDMVWSLVFTRDEQHLFSRDASHTVHRWDIEESRIDLTIKHHTALYAMAINFDSTVIATGGDGGLIYLWDSQTGQLKQDWAAPFGTRIRSLAFDTHGRYLAAGCENGTIALWLLTEQPQVIFLDGHNHPVTSLAFANQGRTLVSSSADRAIKIWDMNTLKPDATLIGHDDIISAVKARPDGKILASSSYDRTIKIWDADSQEPKFVLQGHELPVSAIDLDETGNILVSGSYDRTVRIWDTRDGRLIDAIRGLTFDFRTLAFSADARYIAAGSSDYHVYVWDIHSGTRVQTVKGHLRWVEAVAFHPGGDLLASGSYDRTVRIWNLRTGKEHVILTDHSHWVFCLQFNPNGKYLAAGSVDQTVCVWNLENNRLVQRLGSHESTVTCIAFHPHLPIIASGSRDANIRVWDIETGDLLAVMPVTRMTGGALAFSADGQLLVCATQEGEVLLWDVAAGRLVHRWQFSAEPVQTITLSADGQRLACYGAGRTITCWDVMSGQKVHEVQSIGGKVTSLVFDSLTRQLASGSVDGWGSVWDMQSGASIRTFRMNRPYEGMNITRVAGITAAQREMLKALGAVDQSPTFP